MRANSPKWPLPSGEMEVPRSLESGARRLLEVKFSGKASVSSRERLEVMNLTKTMQSSSNSSFQLTHCHVVRHVELLSSLPSLSPILAYTAGCRQCGHVNRQSWQASDTF